MVSCILRHMTEPLRPAGATAARWTFLTNHAHVLLCIAADHEIRVRQLGARIGITERAVQRILGDLEAAGFVTRERVGRTTRYAVCLDLPMRHPVEASHPVRVLVDALDLGAPHAG